MDMELKEKSIERWKKYFDGAELPVSFYYADEVRGAEAVERPPVSGRFRSQPAMINAAPTSTATVRVPNNVFIVSPFVVSCRIHQNLACPQGLDYRQPHTTP